VSAATTDGLIIFVLSNETKNQSPMRHVENYPLCNEKKLIKSDHSTMLKSFSRKECFEQKIMPFIFGRRYR